jgi:hypothetical protein
VRQFGMAKKTQMSPWVKGPGHNWKTIDRSRQDADADVIEEVSGDRSTYLIVALAILACGVGWWWQSGLDGWARGIVLTLTALLTIYLIVIFGALLLFGWVGRFLRNL